MIVGGVLVILSMLLLPISSDPEDARSIAISFSRREAISKLGVISGVMSAWAIVLGFAHVHHFIGRGSGAAWGRLGYYTLLVASAGITAAGGLLLASIRSSIEWVELGTHSEFGFANAILLASQATFSLALLAFSIALVFIGTAWVRSDVYRRLASWPFLLLASLSFAISITRLLVTPGELFVLFSFGVGSAFGIWFIASGSWLARKTW